VEPGPDSAGQPNAQYRITNDNRKVLLVYSALDRLVDGMGEHQPWVACSTKSLEELWEVDHFDLTLIDVAVPSEHRVQARAGT
jgi:hypothetical protein